MSKGKVGVVLFTGYGGFQNPGGGGTPLFGGSPSCVM